jgi:hypothetical protein
MYAESGEYETATRRAKTTGTGRVEVAGSCTISIDSLANCCAKGTSGAACPDPRPPASPKLSNPEAAPPPTHTHSRTTAESGENKITANKSVTCCTHNIETAVSRPLTARCT